MSDTQTAPLNRLAEEISPYLLQHKDNPVAWRAWGPEAFAEAKQEGKPFDLVMMDLTIPGGLGGQDAVSGIHAISPAVPCIAASGFADEEQAALTEYGFPAFIAKPFDIGQLRSLAKSLLE